MSAESDAGSPNPFLAGHPVNAFEEAVHAHEQWKAMLAHAIRGGGGELRVETIRTGDQCPLGKRLPCDAKSTVRNPVALTMLRVVHAEFNRAAAGVLTLALRGKTREALRGMEPGEPYAQWSAVLMVALVRHVGSGNQATSVPGTAGPS